MILHKHIKWTDEMIDFLKKNHASMSYPKLAAALGLQRTSTRHKCYELGLYKMKLQMWTDEQVEFLKANYQTKGDTELAKVFSQKWEKPKGWSKTHIAKKRGYLKLTRTPAELKAIKEATKARGIYHEANLRRWQIIGANPIGTVVTWAGHRFIKTEKGYQHLRVYNYKKFIGPIPKGMLVIHIDKDPLNCEPENLKLITRAENASRNSKERYPEEYRKALSTFRKLQKIINKKSKQWQETN